jgi:hypothetical protein
MAKRLGWFIVYIKRDGLIDSCGDIVTKDGDSVADMYSVANAMGYQVVNGGACPMTNTLYAEWIKFADPSLVD